MYDPHNTHRHTSYTHQEEEKEEREGGVKEEEKRNRSRGNSTGKRQKKPTYIYTFWKDRRACRQSGEGFYDD